jgi:hypothetical protein
VLVVPVPGATDARLAVEAALARRGWPVASGPADADVLAVAGAPGPALAAVVDAVWEQVPAPRARIEVRAASDVGERLDGAAALLADVDHQRSAPHAVEPGDHAGHDGHGDHGQHSGDGGHGSYPGHGEHGRQGEHSAHGGHSGAEEHSGADEHGSHDEHTGDGEEGGHSVDGGGHSDHDGGGGGGHAGHGRGHHGHHGHGGMVAGLPMAELGPDRDGLTLDRLHVPLGPVLPDWPAGLVVRVTLQGDVIQEASAEVLDAGHAAPFEWPSAAARELDGLARFLGVAGWGVVAARARRLRDAVFAGEDIEAETAALLRRVRRSRTLRWLIRGIPAGAADVAALFEARLAAVEAALPAGAGASPEPEQRQRAPGIAELLVGAELAAARLIVAAVDPCADHLEAGHG